MDKSLNRYGGGKKKVVFDNYCFFKKLSFTLAEVLITLVIIGIIAAITVPVVMSNYRKVETASKLKKFYSNLSNAVRLVETEVGTPVNQWENIDEPNYDEYVYNMELVYQKLSAQKYDAPISYLGDDENSPMYCEGNIWMETYLLPDGTIMGIELFGGDEKDLDYISIDINGEKGPNVCGRDIFNFIVNTNDSSIQAPVRFAGSQYKTREEKLQACKTGNRYCTGLIALDGWEIKNDYPHKI